MRATSLTAKDSSGTSVKGVFDDQGGAAGDFAVGAGHEGGHFFAAYFVFGR